MILTSIFAASLAFGQFPAAPQVYRKTITVGGTLFQAESGKRVSLRVSDASLKEVLGGLEKQKIDFVVDADQFRDRRLTLNLNDVPLGAALAAIAGALDAHWETVGTIRVLKKGAAAGPGSFFQSRGFAAPGGIEQELFTKSLNGDAAKALQQAQKEIKLQIDGLSGAQGDEVRKALEEARKALAQSPNGGFSGLSKADAEEFRKAMERIRGGGMGGTIKPGTVPELRRMGSDGGAKSFTFGGQNLDGLLKSITPAQKELAKKQGYLKSSDLTPEQRKLAGIRDGGGKMEISIHRDGETLTIKSD